VSNDCARTNTLDEKYSDARPGDIIVTSDGEHKLAYCFELVIGVLFKNEYVDVVIFRTSNVANFPSICNFYKFSRDDKLMTSEFLMKRSDNVLIEEL